MPEGAPAGLLPAGTQGPGALALGTDGTVWVAVDGRLRRWTKAGGGVAVDEDPRWTLGSDGAGAIAADGRGRILLARPATDTVERYDPATDAWEILAGKGGRKFTGDGVDDGLEAPGFPAIAPNGDLVFADRGHKQIKRIPAAEL